jgi:broad specificity phosphatase PhoE
MMSTKIVIIRHGKPSLPAWPGIKARELGNWIAAYNRAGIAEESPPEKATSAVKTCTLIVTSDLLRSIESGKALGLQLPMISSELFREAGLPYGPITFVKMPPKMWALFFRILWSFGYEKNGESISAFKERSRRAAERLILLAREHGSVLFVGHGLINAFIARELLSAGWKGPGRMVTPYWARAEYTKEV